MTNINYIECAGCRVPANWTVKQLRKALAKRSMRFKTEHEEEIMRVFGDAILLKKTLEENIDKLEVEVAGLQKLVNEKRNLLVCPGCGVQWTQPRRKQSPEAKAEKDVKKLSG